MNETVEHVGATKPRARISKTADQELKAMKAYVKQVSQNKADSVAFLQRAGILNKNGELAKPYRG